MEQDGTMTPDGHGEQGTMTPNQAENGETRESGDELDSESMN
jgi:hypothetical protein